MNKKILLIAFVIGIVLIAVLTYCYSKVPYSGDGHLIDNGPLAPTDRYVLDLGAIDLNKKGLYSYKINSLPSVNFVVGIEIRVSPEQYSIIEHRNIKPVISLDLTNPQNVQVLHHQSSLDSWAWEIIRGDNFAFVFGKDHFFKPTANSKYTLRVEIVQPDSSNLNYTARLQVKSGGWK
jgi:hypothetical protein